MTRSREEIAQLIDALDTADGPQQNQAIATLVEVGEAAVDPLVASLGLVNARTRQGVARALAQLASPHALLALMRRVFDTRGRIDERDTRGLLMQAIMRTAQPEHAQRLFDFLMDMRQDADPFVRGYAIETLARLGDRRVTAIVQEATQDAEPFVRERAQAALAHLQSHEDQDTLRCQLDDEALLQRLRGAPSSGARAYYMDALREREAAFTLAAQLASEGGKLTTLGLQIMQQLDDPRARQVATQLMARAPEPTPLAISLRLLARHLNHDASDEELRLITQHLSHPDTFVSLAALAAAGASGAPALMRRALARARDGHGVEAAEAAEAIARGVSPGRLELLAELCDALRAAQLRRRGLPSDAHVEAEAHLLGALTTLCQPPRPSQPDELERLALASLQDAQERWPILVSALRLLRELDAAHAPDQARAAWTSAQCAPLVALLGHDEPRVRLRALALLSARCPPGMPGALDALEGALHGDPEVVARLVVPLLRRLDTDRARQRLEALSDHADEQISVAARDALRADRNARPILEARFTRPPD